MLTINKLLPQGHGLSSVLLKRAATVVLDWDTRQKSRFDTDDSQGRHLGVFLPRGTAVRGGDVLVAEDGSLIKVIATPQAVMVVRTCAEHGSAFDLLRAAYHLGNRHVQLELQPEALQLEPDHVLADMLRQMHLLVSEELAPFEPEAGAYAATAHDHAHSHAHTHEPESAPQRKPVPIAVAAAPAPHVHGPGCSHEH
jgi:urease accessory protein